MTQSLPVGVQMTGAISPAVEEVLTSDALNFLAGLQRTFNGRRKELLARRVVRQEAINHGEVPGFLPETASVRLGEWQVAPLRKTSTTAVSKSQAQQNAR